jgi:hypothetical protein
MVGDRGRDQVCWLSGFRGGRPRSRGRRLVISTDADSGCQSTFLTITSKGLIPPECLMVLQEGAWVHNVSPQILVVLPSGFDTYFRHRKKREAKIKRDIKRGIREANESDPFELFIAVTDIRYAYYKDSAKILGQTFGMLVLQDYEAITPNLLARTIETVEGGGIVVLLLKTMSSLRQLYAMAMVSSAEGSCDQTYANRTSTQDTEQTLINSSSRGSMRGLYSRLDRVRTVWFWTTS